NRQINNLENRLKAGLEKFGEGTNNVKIVDILEMNDREKEDKEKKEKEEKEKKEKEEKERKKREKNEKEKEKEKEKDTLDPFDDYLHSYEDKIETGAGAETGGMDRTNDVSQSLVIGVFAGRCSTSPEQQGTSVSSSNATQQANINTNTKETSFS
ncbi:MAG: hypothetical protein LBU15_00995, partial [Rickettsiales bacterium]|nr:hypothetical protein [Rickettsiales bacterium]